MKSNFNGITISGFSAITAAGVGIDPILNNLSNGGSALTTIPEHLIGATDMSWGKADFFKGSDFMPPLKARKLDRSSQFAAAATGLALKSAGIDPKNLDPERIGIAMGCGFGGLGNSSEFLTGYFNSGAEGLAPMLFPNTVSNASASNASIEYGLKGPNVTVVQRFCSAETAFLMACRFLQQGRADIMLVGGVDELNPLIIKGFIALGQHKHFARSFGEGCGMLVLETSDSLKRRNANALAMVNNISCIGMLPDQFATEGFKMLLGEHSASSKIGLSGTCSQTPILTSLLPDSVHISIESVVGHSLAMGATSIACLAASLAKAEKGLHLAASPEGPYFSIQLTGGASE